jgi:hypothetical protein
VERGAQSHPLKSHQLSGNVSYLRPGQPL